MRAAAPEFELQPAPRIEVGLPRPTEAKRPPATTDQYSQMRLAGIVRNGAARHGAELEGSRAKVQRRHLWLDLVEEATKAHRDWYALRHDLRAWYALQPQNEPRTSPAIKAPELGTPEFEWCACANSQIELDDTGMQLEVCEPTIPGRVGPVGGCGGVRVPDGEAAWRHYAELTLAHAGRDWCECANSSAAWASRGAVNLDGLCWCEWCEQPTQPNPLELGKEVIAQYRAVTEHYYRLGAAELELALTDRAIGNEASRRLRGRGLDDVSGDGQLAMLEELRAGLGLEPSPAPGGDASPGDDRDALRRPGLEGEPEAPGGSVSGYQWHKARAKGQREKFDRVRQCGADTMLHRCTACELQGPKIKLSCHNHRLCLGCRLGRIDRFQRRFRDAQKAHLQALWNDPRKLKMNHQGKGGRLRYGGVWGEKFLTLTLPHSGHVKDDVRELQSAWTRFWRLLTTHVTKDLLAGESDSDVEALLGHFRYVRVIEVTHGEDWQGHAHMHLWFVAPFIHQSVLAHLWGEAISQSYKNLLTEAECVRSVDEVIEALPDGRKRYADQLRGYFVTRRGKHGRPLSHVWAPVIDVRKVQSGDMASELCKYLIKDGERNAKTGKLELLDPELFAMVYAALEGTRAISTSRGLFVVVESACYCQDCGGIFRRWIETSEHKPEPRGPPGQLELELSEGSHARE